MNGFHKALGLSAIAFFASPTHAYELTTHGLWTLHSYNTSVLSDPNTQTALGIDAYTFPSAGESSPRPFGDIYIDMGDTVRTRTGKRLERDLMPNDDTLGFHRGNDSLSLPGWLMRGAIREDDVPWIDIRSNDDPVNAIRPLNHFFDPAHNSPLTIGGVTGGIQAGAKNPDWALGTVDAFSNPDQADGLRTNHFSVFDAREAMWRALTLTDTNNARVDSIDGMTKEQIRLAYWATTFRALGDLVHLIQDMAQPQHARNEPHNGLGTESIQDNVTGHGSIFENYIDARALGHSLFRVPGSGVDKVSFIPAPLTFTGYSPVPTLPRYIDFFSTRPNSNTNPGFGMADHANRRFFSEAKNLGSSDLSLPSNDPAAYAPCPVTATNWDGSALGANVQVKLLCTTQANPYIDELSHANAPGIVMTSDSAWNAFLQGPALQRYHLAKEVFDEQAELLIPRGTAYSAGLINFFFRGRMEIKPPDSGFYAFVDHAKFSGTQASSTDVNNGFKGFNKVSLKLRNSTADITTPSGTVVPQIMGPGKLVAVVKFRRNTCYTDDLSGELGPQSTCRSSQEEIVTSNTVTIDQSVSATDATPYTFTFDSEIPINAMDTYLQVVYRGHLGQEADAVAVATTNISEPTYIALSNSHDYVWVVNQVVTRTDLAANKNGSLDQLRTARPDCFDNNNQLTCFNNDENNGQMRMDLTVQVPGGGSTTLTTLALPIGNYVRAAYLTDRNASPSVTLSGCNWSGPSLSAFTQEKTYDSNGQPHETFTSLLASRGVNGWSQLNCVWSADGTSPPTTATLSALANLKPQLLDSTTPQW